MPSYTLTECTLTMSVQVVCGHHHLIPELCHTGTETLCPSDHLPFPPLISCGRASSDDCGFVSRGRDLSACSSVAASPLPLWCFKALLSILSALGRACVQVGWT